MYGMAELQYFFRLPDAFGEERKWRSALSSFKEQYGDVGFPIDKFNVSLNFKKLNFRTIYKRFLENN